LSVERLPELLALAAVYFSRYGLNVSPAPTEGGWPPTDSDCLLFNLRSLL